MEREIRLVAIGDSIIRGTADIESGGWINRVFEKLVEAFPALVLFNQGIGGDTSRGVLSRIWKDCIDYKPDMVIAGVGVNDSRRRESLGNVTEIPVSEFEQNIEKIIDVIRGNTRAQIILAGMVPVDDRGGTYKKDKVHFRKDQNDFEAVIERIASKNRLPYLDFFREWLGYGDEEITSMLIDGLHPTSQGHARMAEYSLSVIYDSLSKASQVRE